MTNRVEFTAYYMRSIWRVGDTELAQDMPRLIREAEARISRDLRDSNMVISATILFNPDEGGFALPPDFRELASINLNNGKIARVVSPDTVDLAHHNDRSRHFRNEPYTPFSIVDRTLIFYSDDAAPTTGTLRYYAGILPIEDDTEQSFYDLHPDFFMAAMNTVVYNYLREFELSQEYNGRYLALLEDMRRQSNYAMFPSGQLTTPLSNAVR